MKLAYRLTLLLSLLPALAHTEAHAENKLSLQQLMQLTQQQQQDDATLRSQRLQAFIAARDQAAAKVAELRQQVRKARSSNQSLQTDYDQQHTELTRLDQQISERSGNLTAVFASARQSAGEMAESLRYSLASAQAPDQVTRMEQLADKQQPDINDLRLLWHVMQKDILAASQSVRFSAPVITADGQRESAEVVRLGLFSAVSEGRYLHYDAGLGALNVLRRQPEAELRKLAAAYQQAADGPVTVVIDPTRGNLLSLTTQRPALSERLQQGGRVGYLILALGVIGILLALWRWAALAITTRRMHQQLTQLDTPTNNNPLGRVLAGYTYKTDDIDSVAMQLEEAILRETPQLTRGEALLKLLAGIAPLLGLLGTVTGMIATFQSISLFGAGDPRLMADGISQALVTTALGLLVAIPLLLSHLLVSAHSRRLVNLLEEQSAGLIARSQGWRE